MRSFAFEELGTEEFDEFSATHPQGNFQQTSLMGEVRTRRGIEVRYLGVREDGKLVAAAELEIHKSRLSTFAEVHNGPLCDFHDAELTRFLFENLARVADEAGCAQIEITPDKPWAVRTSDGEELEEGAERPAGVPDGAPAGVDQASFDNIVACGFVHDGFDRQYNAVPRWRYLKDLTPFEDDAKLLSSYNKNTKRNVKIARNSSVHVERASREDLPTFHALCEKSCEKQGFENIAKIDWDPHTTGGVIAMAAATSGRQLDAKYLIAFTQSGDTASRMSRLRSDIPLLAFTPDEKTARWLTLCWGARVIQTPSYGSNEEMVTEVNRQLQELKLAEEGDVVILVCGAPMGIKGKTNTMRVHRLKDISWVEPVELPPYMKNAT